MCGRTLRDAIYVVFGGGGGGGGGKHPHYLMLGFMSVAIVRKNM